MTARPPGGVALGLLADAGHLVLLWLMIPFVILLAGLPVVLVIRGLAELARMLFGG